MAERLVKKEDLPVLQALQRATARMGAEGDLEMQEKADSLAERVKSLGDNLREDHQGKETKQVPQGGPKPKPRSETS
jgi:hypothetical protein